MREVERDQEFPPGYIHVLGWLKSKGGPVSMSDLACASFVSKPNLTTMVDRLCADGLVERSAAPNDRRVVNVAITQEGLNFLIRHKQEVAKFIAGRLSLLDDADLDRLKSVVDELTEILQTLGEKQRQQTDRK
jgi:DNA-binding MarR family transcriptional regulator